MRRKVLIGVGIGLVVVFLGIQFIPVSRTNPAVTREIRWDSPETRQLAKRACYDCHSNETVWPWYASVAPVSWLVARDVNGARRHLNFSEWDRPNEDAEEIVEQVEDGEMPLKIYLPLHPEARLSDEQRAPLVAGLRATLQLDPPVERETRRSEETH